MHWERRRDLEGGKELGVWLLVDESGTVDTELYVESHEYRGGGFDVYTATPEGDWEHKGEFASVQEAFEQAIEFLSDNPHQVKTQTS